MAIQYPTGETHYKGAVLDRYEQNLAHDSYFHAVVWDGQKVTTVETHSTAYGGPWPTVDIDATQDVIDAALAWYRPLWLKRAIRDAERIRAEVQVGRTVRSTTTRGKNVGVTGTVQRVVPNTYSRRDDALRVQVKLDATGELRWLDGDRLEVTGLEPIDLTDLQQAAQYANPNGWRNAVAGLAG